MNPVQKAKQIIEEHLYMTVATSSVEGEPWISPVFYAFDEHYNLFWVSNKDARHSQLIGANPRVAIVIFNSIAEIEDVDAVYIEATAAELAQPGDIQHAMKVLAPRVLKDEFLVKDESQVTGEAVWRIYRAVPHSVSKLTAGEYINGQYVDRREPIQLT
jgi:uncharacterized protein YhbP (UPF0306 family)